MEAVDVLSAPAPNTAGSGAAGTDARALEDPLRRAERGSAGRASPRDTLQGGAATPPPGDRAAGRSSFGQASGISDRLALLLPGVGRPGTPAAPAGPAKPGRRNDLADRGERNDKPVFLDQRDNETSYELTDDLKEKIHAYKTSKDLQEWKEKPAKWEQVRSDVFGQLTLAIAAGEKAKAEADAAATSPPKTPEADQKKAADKRKEVLAKAELASSHLALFKPGALPTSEASDFWFTWRRPSGMLDGLDKAEVSNGKTKVKVADRMCNVTALAMVVGQLVGSVPRARRVAADILSESCGKAEFATMPDEALQKMQLEDLLDLIVTAKLAGDLGAASDVRESQSLALIVDLFKAHKGLDGKHDTAVGSLSYVAPNGQKSNSADPKDTFTKVLPDGIFGKKGISLAQHVNAGGELMITTNTPGPGKGHWVKVDKVHSDGVSLMDPYCANLVVNNNYKLVNEGSGSERTGSLSQIRAVANAGGVEDAIKTRFRFNPAAEEAALQLLEFVRELPSAEERAKAAGEKVKKQKKLVDSLPAPKKAGKQKLTPAEETENSNRETSRKELAAQLKLDEEAAKQAEARKRQLTSPVAGKDGVTGPAKYGDRAFYTWSDCKAVVIPSAAIAAFEKADPAAKDTEKTKTDAKKSKKS